MSAAWTIFWVLFFTALAWLTFTGGDKWPPFTSPS